MSKASLKTSSTRTLQNTKWSKKDLRLKPFGFCCSMDRFNELSTYDQRKPPYKSSLTAISSVHECPVSKMQVAFFTPEINRERKRLNKIKASNAGIQQRSKNQLNYFRIGKNNRSIKWYLEDEIALAKDIFWVERQKIYNEASNKAIIIAKKKFRGKMKKLLSLNYPRWYQDFSLDQMKNLMNLENMMYIDYKETTTNGTQMTLMAIGVTSTFFKLKPNVIKELHKSCDFNSVRFLREVYRILTGNDFYEERYKKFYDCNERIILSAIAFLTLPETLEELHKRLPAVVMPRFPAKPRPPICLERRKSSCPYNEELFKRPAWADYRNALQKWHKQCKLFAIPKVILPIKGSGQFFINDKIQSAIKRQKEDICIEHFEKTDAKELQKISVTEFDQTGIMNTDGQLRYKDSSGEKNLEAEVSATFISRLLKNGKKFDFTTGLDEKPEAMEYKVCSTLKPPGANQKSWLGEKDAHYVIAGTSEGPPSCPPTYEITGVANVTPTNSDEKFFAVLKLDDKPKKIFPSGRENLSRNWQEWLQNVDEEFSQVEEKTDELIKSVQTTTKLAFPEPVCDSCCSCRQTRKTYEKLRQTKTPHLLIDSVVQDREKKCIIGSMAMHSPGPSPTGSPINLLERAASQDEIKTNIIDDVTYENGKTHYHISGVQKERVHVSSTVPSIPPAPQSIKNVPPCACAIQQMTNKDVSPSASKDDIPWTKDEGLCLGKKYRPGELGGYSCKMYPGDKSCRRNPFMKEIIKMRNKEREKEEKEERKKEAETIDMIKKEIQIPTKKVTEKKTDRFIPDPDYPAYDNPWNISRTAPSAEIVKTDYEATLKLTPPALPVTSAPLRTQKRKKDALKEFKKAKKNILNEGSDQKNPKISLKSSNSIQEMKNNEKRDLKNTKKRKNKSAKKIIAEGGSKLSTNIFKSPIINRPEKKQETKSLFNKSVKQRQPKIVDKIHKRGFGKSDIKKTVDEDRNEAVELDNRKQEMARLRNMFKFSLGGLDDIQPAILPEELPVISLEEQREEIDSPARIDEEESRDTKKEPCGWRTKSELELPAKKTLAYLCEPDYPLETMPVRPGGRPCQCRENRSKKKILMYNVGGLLERKIGGMRAKKAKLEGENRIIDGVVYFTPPSSPRRSDEYVPEYELLDSPYDMCVGEAADKRLKLIEKYSGPKSLVEKIREKPKSCDCSSIIKKDGLVDQKRDIEEERRKLMESKSPEERWRTALKDAALMDHFTQRKDNAPCWTSCKKFARSVRPRRLKVIKPVCECKYERKILERNEERAEWKARQRRLKGLKKQSFMHIVDTSRPIIKDTKFILSGVKRIPGKGEREDDIQCCISGVAETAFMSPPQQIVDGLKMSTPLQTPEPSKEDISRAIAPHRHWSPMNIPPGPLPRKDATVKAEMERRKKATDKAFRSIYGDKSEQDASCLTHRQEAYDEEKLTKGIEKAQSRTSIRKEISESIMSSRLLSEKTSSKIGYQKVSSKEIIGEVTHVKKQYSEGITGEVDRQGNALYKQIIVKTDGKIDDEKRQINGGGDKKRADSEFDLMAIIKVELKKMAVEGYTFAMLPECYLMPQLQSWLMHRKGVVFSEADKKNLMRETRAVWEFIDVVRTPKIEALSLCTSQLKSLTYSRAKKIKEKIEKKRAIFHSEVRKARVSYARSMWGTMEFERFPSTSFKRAFFTYMASKEADGHVYKPWLHSEIREPDLKFSCY